VPGPYWQEPAGADYGRAGYGGNGRGGGRDGYLADGGRASQGGSASRADGRANGWDSAAVRSSEDARGGGDPWDLQRGRGGGRRSRPEPVAREADGRGRGGSRRGGSQPPGPAPRSPQGARRDRGYGPERESGAAEVAQDLRDRLGLRGPRNERGPAPAPGPARSNGAANNGAANNGAANNGAGNYGAGYAGYNGAGYARDGNDQRGQDRPGVNGAARRGARANGAALNGAAQSGGRHGTGRGAELKGAGGNGAGSRTGQGYGSRGGRTATGYAEDDDGRTLQRGRPGAAGGPAWPDGEDDPRAEGPGRRSGSGNGGRGAGRGGGGPGGPGRPGGGRRGLKEWFLSGTWWRRWTWKKALGVAAAIIVGIPVLLLVAFIIEYTRTPLPTATKATATAEPSQVYFGNGHLIASFSDGGLNRQILTAQQIPAVMSNAVIAAEDRHFYSEGGISVTGILRAAYHNLKGGAVSQGGSTLTEQLVKNYYAGFATASNSTGSASVKFKQILVAIKLAHTKSKSWILTQYLNTVYFGQNAYGVGAAAQAYFNEPASSLTVSQAAMLAAMVNEPGYFSPDPHAGSAYTDLVARWDYVLTNMVRDRALTSAQKAHEAFPKVHFHLSSSLNGYKGYLMQMVNQELTSTYHLTQAQITTGGLKIYTTFSESKMNGLYRAVAANKAQMAADGHPLPSYAYIGAVLERPTDGSILAVYGGPGYTSNYQACLRVDCQLNMAEDPKQVGSSFKPYVLATAVSQGMNVQTSKLNGYSPLWIPVGQTPADQLALSLRTPPTSQDLNQRYYFPFNEPSEDSKHPLTVATAAAISSDPAFEDLAHRDGVQNVIDMTKQFGVGQTPFTQGTTNDWTAMNAQFGKTSKLSTGGSVAIALGESDLTAVEQASTFATLADGGVYHTPHVIARIVEGGGSLPLRVVSHTVLQPDQAADVDYALSFDNVPGGTAYPNAAWPGQPVIGKTGTTQTAQDAWFVGAIPGYSLGVTIFTNRQNSSLSPGSQTLDVLPVLPGGNPVGGYGGEWPAAIWHTFMMNEFATMAPQPLPTPNFNGFALWDQVNGAQSATPTPTPSANAQPTQTPTPTPTPGCTPAPGFVCTPAGSLSPSPPSVSTAPPGATSSPTCTPQPGPQPCQVTTPPGQQGHTVAAVIQTAAGTSRTRRLLRAQAVLAV